MMPITRSGNLPDINRMTERLKREIPLVVANKAKNHYLDGFRRGGYATDNSMGGWQARKKADKRNRKRRAILVKKEHLKEDLDIRKTTFNEIVLGTEDTIYASVHNNGERAGRGGGFDMPQREFLGNSRALDAKIVTLIKKKMRQHYG